MDPLLTFDQFQENVVVEGIFEPFNGGFFLLKAGYLDEVQQIIEQREAMAAALEYAHFDLQMGWGHDLTNDPWISERDTGTKWTCLAAFADQGLLYYYTKYHRKSVSVLRRNGMIHHYGWNETAVAEIGRQKSMDIVKDNPKMIRVPGKHLKLNYPFNCFVHFTGSHKPWLKGRAPNDCCIPKTKHKSAQHYWMYELSELLKGRNDVDIRTHWSKQKKKHLPPLGMFPTYSQVVNASTNVLTPLQMIGSNG